MCALPHCPASRQDHREDVNWLSLSPGGPAACLFLSGRLFVVVLVGLLFVCLVGTTLYAQGDNSVTDTSISVDAYRDRLQAARDALTDADDPVPILAAVRADIASVERVELCGGAVIDVKPLLGTEDQPISPDVALARLELVIAQLDAAETDNTVSRLAVLAEVLQRPEFNAGETLWDQLQRWLNEWLAGWLPQSENAASAAAILANLVRLGAWAIGGIGLVVIIWLLAYWLRGVLQAFVADANTHAEIEGDELPRTPAEARARADTLARAGDYRNGVRHLYLAALLTLEQRRLVTVDRSLTDRELLARVPSEHPIQSHLQPVVETFDDVWYGVHEPDAATFASYSRSIDALQSLAGAE